MELAGFEKFTDHGKSFHPKISIRKRGQIGFNSGAINRCHLDSVDYAVLYYNKVRKQIAFQFTNDEKEEGALKIQKRPSNYFFSGKSFLDFYSIEYGETVAFEIDWDENNNVAVIDVSQLVKD